MSKFKGKFTKKKEFEGERTSFEKEKGGRGKSSKDRSGKYRKKNFRDFEKDSDEEGSRRSALKDLNTPQTPESGLSAADKPYQKGNRTAGKPYQGKPERNARFSDSRSGDSRSGDSRRDSARGERNSKNRREGIAKKPAGETKKPFSKGRERQATPPVYDSFSSLQKGKGASAEERNIRLNKYIADAGVCSRREADKLIEAGEIAVNGQVIQELGYKVSRKDVVTYGGKKLRPEKLVYVLLNKPKDFISTVDDPEDRKTVMQLVDNAAEERIYPVGRLDRNTTGLLLLTNDGELAKKLTHPSHNVKKIYQVDLDKPITDEDLEKIQEGIMLEDGEAKVDEVAVLSKDGTILGVEIHIGRNRIVRRIFEHLGYEVVRLDRVMFAGLTKKDLPRGNWRYLSEKELIRLKHFI